jgi:hypothetical protein
MPEPRRPMTRFERFAYRHPWTFVAVPAVAAGLAMLVACAARDWHAPPLDIIAILLAGTFGLGVLMGRATFALRSETDRRRLLDGGALRTTSASLATLAATSVLGAGLLFFSAAVVYQLLGDVPRVLASVLAALFTAAGLVVVAGLHTIFSQRVSVGMDAVAIGRNVVRFGDLARAEVDGSRLVLVLASGRTMTAHLASHHLASALAEPIQARIEDAFQAPAALHRAGRPLREWQGALTSAGYRDDHVSVEEAERVLGSARASADERVGAALVLVHAKRVEPVRVAAAECVEPRMRVALERAANDTLDDEVLERLAARRR